MIYLSVASIIEAKPIIKYLDLKKDKNFIKAQVFFNENVTLIITGVGNIDAAIVLTHVFSKLKITRSDLLINMGICFGKNHYNSGDVVICNKIINVTTRNEFYPDMIYNHNFIESSVENLFLLLDENESRDTLVDYESVGIYKSGSYFFDNNQIIFIKIFYRVGDYDINLDEITDADLIVNDVTDEITNEIIKDKIKDKLNKIINNNLESIFSWIFEISELLKYRDISFSTNEKEIIDKFIEKFKFSVTMSIEFKNLLKYYKLNNKNIGVGILLEKYFNEETINKKRGKHIFELVKKEIME
jgi:hypothetical protein